MRQKIRFLALLAVIILLCGCQGRPLPEGMDEETLLSRGREVAILLAGGSYEEVWEQMREDVAAGVKVEDIQKLVLTQANDAGTYRQIESAMATGQSSDGEEYGVAVFYCDYSKKKMLFRLAFDTNYELIGIEIKKT